MPDEEDAKTITDSQFEVSLGQVGPGAVVFGRFKLQSELGRGGMGVVWLAHDERIDVPVALKFLPDVVARDTESVDELKRELRRGLNLTHPGIVRVYSFEQDEHGAAIAMEYVDGPALGGLKLKQPGGCFDCDDLLPWLDQLCAALDYAHFEAKIVHRDLKPRNLMLTSKGKLKIADFGVATSISDTMSRATMRKDGSGTPPYMSPQQAFGEDPSPSDDIYSLGATIYELLTGRPPFYQGNILAQVQQRMPPTMTERREVLKITGKKPIPEHWERTIAACLAKRVEDRPRRSSEVLEELRGLRAAPATVTHTDRPINPMVTLSSAGPAPLGAYAQPPMEEEAQTIRGGVLPVPTPRPGQRWLPYFVLGGLVVAGAGLWWWQQQADAAARARIRAESQAALTGAATPVPAGSPDPAEAARLAAEEKARMEKEALEREAAAAEAKLMAEGKIPRPGAEWQNSLGMKFLAAPGLQPLIGVHEVRLGDYRAFTEDTKRPYIPPEFPQQVTHPVVNVSWLDAQAFCEWLTARERAEGKLGTRQRYRLLTDAEWSKAVGLAEETGNTPAEKHLGIKGIFAWGTLPLPPDGTENLAGQGETSFPERELLGYNDKFTHTAPVGSFPANTLGLHDLGGNVAEWVEDWFDASQVERTMRGAAFIYLADFDRNASFRWHLQPGEKFDYIGFRVALDCGPQP
jgi:hypothetical protein